jgi:hypothetical protein
MTFKQLLIQGVNCPAICILLELLLHNQFDRTKSNGLSEIFIDDKIVHDI